MNTLFTKIQHIIHWLTEKEFRLAIFLFLTPLVLGLFVQLVLLTYLFPQWAAGDGLLLGGDSYSFHKIALELTEKIQQDGWSAWELRPNNQSPAGIAAIFYSLLTPHPWVLLPLNAFFHALSSFLLYRIIKLFSKDSTISFLAILPFHFYPSAMLWYAQIHKDGYYIAGFLLFTYGWIRLVTGLRKSYRYLLGNVVFMIIGVLLLWIARYYSVEIFQGGSLFMALFSTTIIVISLLKRKTYADQSKSEVTHILIKSGITVFSLWMITFGMNPDLLVKIMPEKEQSSSSDPIDDPKGIIENYDEISIIPWKPAEWKNTGWPLFIEARAYKISGSRDSYRIKYPDAASNIDMEVSFSNISDIIRYIPRALEIGFLAPFPSQWFQSGTYEANTMMRRISAVEMIGVYISLLGLPLGLFYWGKEHPYWIILGFCLFMILLYSLVVTNVGTLYRFRYGFIMSVVTINYAALFTYIKGNYHFSSSI